MLLRDLVRGYIAKGINNHADFTKKNESFLSEKEFDLLKPLTDFSIVGACPNKPSG